jgi:uncharacterized protein YidB (DUF937 family)
MFDQILQLVKEHIGNNPQISSTIPGDKQEAVNNEIAGHITNGLQNQAVANGGAGGLLSMLQNAMASGSPVTSAIEGGLVSSLASKFGLPPMATGAIAGALPGILQKFARKANDPNDNSITTESITKSLSGKLGGLGNLFNR